MMQAIAQSTIIDFPVPTPQQKSNEWYTPARYVEAARQVMGGIDLDPASCEQANRTVKAARYYTKEENGMAHPWHGRVWLNPPFGRVDNKSVLGMFVAKLLDSYYQGNVEQAVLLSTARTDNKQLNRLWDFPLCFPDHHVNFYCPGGERESVTHMHGAAFVYLGPSEAHFIDIFRQFGRIARAIDTPRQRVNTPSLWEGTP